MRWPVSHVILSSFNVQLCYTAINHILLDEILCCQKPTTTAFNSTVVLLLQSSASADAGSLFIHWKMMLSTVQKVHTVQSIHWVRNQQKSESSGYVPVSKSTVLLEDCVMALSFSFFHLLSESALGSSESKLIEAAFSWQHSRLEDWEGESQGKICQADVWYVVTGESIWFFAVCLISGRD